MTMIKKLIRMQHHGNYFVPDLAAGKSTFIISVKEPLC